MPTVSTPTHPIVLLILDGFGHREDTRNNAIAAASTPHYDKLINTCPWRLIDASGTSVGLPEAQIGNSEVGHMTLGAGRVIWQNLSRINRDLSEGALATNRVWQSTVQRIQAKGSTLHLWGLVSDGGVHSHVNHLLSLIRAAQDSGIGKVVVHAVLDGRDVPPRSAEPSLRLVEDTLAECGYAPISDIAGRYYAMDRDNNHERLNRAWNLYCGEASVSNHSAIELLNKSYEQGVNDEFCEPQATSSYCQWHADDEVVLFNFRADRARQLTDYLVNNPKNDQAVNDGDWPKQPVTMTEYQANLGCEVLFAPSAIDNTLGEYLAQQGMRQLRIAETEKYAHVTYFFNGGREQPFVGEEHVLVPSPKVATYDLKPEMSVYEVTEKLCMAVRSHDYQVLVCNFANGDMVGHTGNFEAAVRAIQAMDECLGLLMDAVADIEGGILITADHGNAETMHDHVAGQPHTAHTTQPVPLIYYGKDDHVQFNSEQSATLADIAPTLLGRLGLPVPPEMTGTDLLS